MIFFLFSWSLCNLRKKVYVLPTAPLTLLPFGPTPPELPVWPWGPCGGERWRKWEDTGEIMTVKSCLGFIYCLQLLRLDSENVHRPEIPCAWSRVSREHFQANSLRRSRATCGKGERWFIESHVWICTSNGDNTNFPQLGFTVVQLIRPLGIYKWVQDNNVKSPSLLNKTLCMTQPTGSQEGVTLTKMRAAKARFNFFFFFFFFRFTLWLYNNTCITHDCISQIVYDFLFGSLILWKWWIIILGKV